MELRDIRAGYEAIEVLHGVSFGSPRQRVRRPRPQRGGEDDDAAGDRRIAQPPDEGDILIAGRRVNGAKADALARHGVCTIPEGRGIFPNLTVRENLWMATYAWATRPTSRKRPTAAFPG